MCGVYLVFFFSPMNAFLCRSVFGFFCFCTCFSLQGVLHAVNAAAPDMASFKPAPLFDSKAISEKTLPNGVRGLVRSSAGSGLVCVQVWVKAGARYEGDNNSGVSRLLAEAGLNGSKNYPRRSEAGGTLRGGARESLETIGGDVKTFTSRDATFWSVTIASSYLPQALRAFSDAVLRPDLSSESVAEAREDVAGQQRRRESDALDASLDIAYRLAFEKHPYRKPAGGTSQSIETVTTNLARSYHQARFVGPNISVVVVGEVSPGETQALIAQFFSDAPAKATTTNQVGTTPEIAPPAFKTLARRFATQNKVVTLGFRAPGMNNPTDVVATDILLSHWKEGEAAHLKSVLLGLTNDDDEDEEAGSSQNSSETGMKNEAPALGFDVDYLTQHDPGLMTVTLVVNPDSRSKDAVTLLMDEIERVQRDGLGADALTRAKQSLKRQYIAQSDTASGQAGALGFYDMIGGYSFAVDYLDRIGRISSEDVRRVAQKYLSRTSYVQVIAEPNPSERPDKPGAPLEGGSGSITASLQVPPSIHVPLRVPVRAPLPK
jgi:zinc protease